MTIEDHLKENIDKLSKFQSTDGGKRLFASYKGLLGPMAEIFIEQVMEVYIPDDQFFQQEELTENFLENINSTLKELDEEFLQILSTFKTTLPSNDQSKLDFDAQQLARLKTAYRSAVAMHLAAKMGKKDTPEQVVGSPVLAQKHKREREIAVFVDIINTLNEGLDCGAAFKLTQGNVQRKFSLSKRVFLLMSSSKEKVTRVQSQSVSDYFSDINQQAPRERRMSDSSDKRMEPTSPRPLQRFMSTSLVTASTNAHSPTTSPPATKTKKSLFGFGKNKE